MQNKNIKIAILVTLLVFAAVTAFVVINNNNANKDTVHSDQPSIEGQPTMGNVDAPVQVVEFGDFKCPACKRWGEEVYPQLVEDYIDNDKASFSYINVLFHGEESILASLAAESVFKADPDSYWAFHKKVFDEQPSVSHDGAWVTVEKMLEVAEATTNMDLQQLESELQEETMMEELNTDMALVEKFEVALTPSIMVNGTMLEDPFDYDAIKALIDEALEDE
ncbi:DsbA family protein [Jeotgalibacillus marinus]|uniref:DsbA family protein n=1 Tax=Jeotgalibacillus marinus TaxID=86667 RepID=A0ABV3Q6V0_9BACL